MTHPDEMPLDVLEKYFAMETDARARQQIAAAIRSKREDRRRRVEREIENGRRRALGFRLLPEIHEW